MACDPGNKTMLLAQPASLRGSILLLLTVFFFSAQPAFCQSGSVPSDELAPQTQDAEVVDAAQEVDGITLTNTDMQPKKAVPIAEVKKKRSGFGLNPLNWVYEPISRMQETIVKLEQQIVRLEAPIAGLQKPMLGLRRDLKKIDFEIKDVRTEMQKVSGTLNATMSEITGTKDAMLATNKAMEATRDELAKTKAEVVSTKNEIRATKDAVTSTKQEISETTYAVTETKKELVTTNAEMRSVHETISQMGDKLNALEKTVQELRGPIQQLPKPVAGVEKHLENLETNLQSLRESVNRTSNLILAAILLASFMVCVGTPIMALLAFKYRKRIMESLHQRPTLDDDMEETLADATPKSYTSIKPSSSLGTGSSSLTPDRSGTRPNSLRR